MLIKQTHPPNPALRRCCAVRLRASPSAQDDGEKSLAPNELPGTFLFQPICHPETADKAGKLPSSPEGSPSRSLFKLRPLCWYNCNHVPTICHPETANKAGKRPSPPEGSPLRSLFKLRPFCWYNQFTPVSPKLPPPVILSETK